MLKPIEEPKLTLLEFEYLSTKFIDSRIENVIEKSLKEIGYNYQRLHSYDPNPHQRFVVHQGVTPQLYVDSDMIDSIEIKVLEICKQVEFRAEYKGMYGFNITPIVSDNSAIPL